MKHIVFERYGPPARVVKCVETEDPSAPGDWEVAVDISATAINPSDISMLRGQYGVLPPRLPATIGLEASGRVTSVGSSVKDLSVGDRVIVVANDNWQQRRKVQYSLVHKIPDELDDLQAAMVKTNSICAYMMLTTAEDVEPGDFIIQSAPLSAVGRMVIGMAKALGYRTVNIVRRPDAVKEVLDLGGDIALTDGEDIGARVAKATHDAPILLGLDAVAGETTGRIADCLDTGASLISYGMLSGEPIQLRPDHTIFKDIRLKGFWLSKILNRMSQKKRSDLFSDCLDLMVKHGLRNEVGKTFPLEDISAAIEYAEAPERRGKVLLLPNGPIAA